MAIHPITLNVPAALPTRASDCVNFVDKDDARLALLGRLEEVADAARADTDKHLEEFRARGRQEGNAGLASGGLVRKSGEKMEGK